VRVMKTHIGEIEKPKKTDNETNIKLLDGTERNLEPDEFCRSQVAGVSRQLERIEETRTKLRDFGLNAKGNCFVCDPDWCPDYKKRECNGKRPT
jgi:hypothetical protein